MRKQGAVELNEKILLMFSSDFHLMSVEIQEQVYKEYYNLVYDMLLNLIKDHVATEDIIQESFLKALKKHPRYLDSKKIQAWLKTLTKNTAYNYLRKHKKHRDELSTSDVYLETSMVTNQQVPSVEQEIERILLWEQIAIAINQLKLEYRDIIILKYVHELTYKEISKYLNMTEGAVRQKLARARKAAKKILLNSEVTINEERAIR